MKIAVLSNVNCDPLIKKAQKFCDCIPSAGYGAVLEQLLNPDSELQSKEVEVVFLIMDSKQLLFRQQNTRKNIDDFFHGVKTSLQNGKCYFISTAYFYSPLQLDYKHTGWFNELTEYWNNALESLCQEADRVYSFPLDRCVQMLGEQTFYSQKAWYSGSVRYSLAGINAIFQEMKQILETFNGQSKKLLALDLDNTLWGGIIGEDGADRILLADSGIGKAYKDFQEILFELKNAGVLLAVVSKNNLKDVFPIMNQHAHMLIKESDFIIKKINWNSKAQNIMEIAQELNIGLSSIVFVDDNPVERAEVKMAIPEITIPDFPEYPEDLMTFGMQVAIRYFKRLNFTEEDQKKSEQYLVKQKIDNLSHESVDFSSFLNSLRICVTACDPKENEYRFLQLLHKTNQFNTTVNRYSHAKMAEMLDSTDYRLYIFRVSDCFTDHGLCALAVVHVMHNTPVIENFVMSCRVMGRNIEYGILSYIIKQLVEEGFSEINALYCMGPKNMPVESFYDKAGFQIIEQEDKLKKYSYFVGATNAFINIDEKFVGILV